MWDSAARAAGRWGDEAVGHRGSSGRGSRMRPGIGGWSYICWHAVLYVVRASIQLCAWSVMQMRSTTTGCIWLGRRRTSCVSGRKYGGAVFRIMTPLRMWVEVEDQRLHAMQNAIDAMSTRLGVRFTFDFVCWPHSFAAIVSCMPLLVRRGRRGCSVVHMPLSAAQPCGGGAAQLGRSGR